MYFFHFLWTFSECGHIAYESVLNKFNKMNRVPNMTDISLGNKTDLSSLCAHCVA